MTATSEGKSGDGTVSVQVPGTIPLEYRLDRPQLVNNPGALVSGEDWQSLQTDQDLYALGFFSHIGGDITRTRQAVLEKTDPTFGTVVKCYNTDALATTFLPNATDHGMISVLGARSFTPVDRGWIRVLVKYQSGFTTVGPTAGANAWKMIFVGDERPITFSNTYDYIYGANHGGWPGTGSLLPNIDSNGGGNANPAQGNTEWTDEEWWEYIIFMERLSSSHYRIRYWRRELTSNGVVTGPASSATWDHRWGFEVTGGSIPSGIVSDIQLGITRNKPMNVGQFQHWFWGPWEVIDASVLPDPYGIENQIR